MYLCFIDESGTPPKPTKANPRPYFTLAAVFMPVTQWKGIETELQRLKSNKIYKIRGELKWRYFGRDNNDNKNNVRHLSEDLQDSFRKELYKILSSRNSVKVVIAVTDVKRAYAESYYHDEHDIYAYAYKQIVERFQYHLQELSRSVGSEQYGVVVADHRGKDDDARLRRYHQILVNAGSKNFSRISNLVESVFLTPSDLSMGIQLADMIAGAANRRYCSDDRRYSESIKPILRTNAQGKTEGFGLLKIPKGTW